MVEAKVAGVVLNSATGTPVVILKDDKNRALPIVIGFFEAQSILLVLEKVKLPRPLTHDLTKSIIEELKSEFVRLEITTLKENTFYAQICLKFNGEVKYIDCRPSDGIALALRFKVPIFVSEELMKETVATSLSPGSTRPIGLQEVARFRKTLEDLKAKDFWKRLKEEKS